MYRKHCTQYLLEYWLQWWFRRGLSWHLLYGFGMVKHIQLCECTESEWSLGVKLIAYDLLYQVPVTWLQCRVTKVSDGRYLNIRTCTCTCIITCAVQRISTCTCTHTYLNYMTKWPHTHPHTHTTHLVLHILNHPLQFWHNSIWREPLL